jgi:hypothetical protein
MFFMRIGLSSELNTKTESALNARTPTLDSLVLYVFEKQYIVTYCTAVARMPVGYTIEAVIAHLGQPFAPVCPVFLMPNTEIVTSTRDVLQKMCG